MRSRSPEPGEPVLGPLRVAELLAVAGVGLGLALLVHRVGRAVEGFGDAALVALAALAGWVLADLVSGVVHWWADRVASEDTPLLGPHFVRPFREHHEDPEDLVERTAQVVVDP